MVILCCVLVALFAGEALQSKAAKPRPAKPRPGRHYPARRTVPARTKPDPALQWGDCGDNCLVRQFNDDLSTVRIAPVTATCRISP